MTTQLDGQLKMEVSRIKQYGRDEYKPECEVSRKFTELLKQKVLTIKDIEKIKQLGYRVLLKSGEL